MNARFIHDWDTSNAFTSGEVKCRYCGRLADGVEYAENGNYVIQFQDGIDGDGKCHSAPGYAAYSKLKDFKTKKRRYRPLAPSR